MFCQHNVLAIEVMSDSIFALGRQLHISGLSAYAEQPFLQYIFAVEIERFMNLASFRFPPIGRLTFPRHFFLEVFSDTCSYIGRKTSERGHARSHSHNTICAISCSVVVMNTIECHN